jgi:hypothetical protein
MIVKSRERKTGTVYVHAGHVYGLFGQGEDLKMEQIDYFFKWHVVHKKSPLLR